MSDYINKLNKDNICVIEKIKEEALDNTVPIIKDDSLAILLLLIKQKRFKTILEIGTAVGYSSIMMAFISSDITIDTIERDDTMYNKAIENITRLGLIDRISIHHEDALTIDLTKLKKEYDLIFIDAAKAQYQKFFEKYAPLLNDNGIIFTDNLLFHGLVEKYVNNELTDVSKNLRSLVKKISEYNYYLSNNIDYDTTFYDIGDGIAITSKKDEHNE